MNRVRAAYGLVLLVEPDLVARRLRRKGLTPAERLTARVLGMRHLAQAMAEGWTSARAARIAGAGVDALHGVSMIATAVLLPAERRLALADSVVAFGFAVTSSRAR